MLPLMVLIRSQKELSFLYRYTQNILHIAGILRSILSKGEKRAGILSRLGNHPVRK
jgi:hypothetical protein